MASSSPLQILLLLLLLLLSIHVSAAQSPYKNITTGTTLYPTTHPTSWPSPSGDFAFGFLPLPTDTSLFLLAIWFDKLPNKTVIWYANGNNPVSAAASKAVLLKISDGGQFSLLGSSGQEIWNPDVTQISHAAILDTGNLVLSAADSTVLWQSFDNPANTILPGQILNQNTRPTSCEADGYRLRRRKVRTRAAKRQDGNLVMYPLALPTGLPYDDSSYWSTATFGSGIKLVYNESGSIYLAFSNGSVHQIIPGGGGGGGSSDSYYQRTTLDPDGVFRQYSFPKNEPNSWSWTVTQKVASDICTLLTGASGPGACGFNSYCTYDSQGMVDCMCPSYYSFFDEDRKYQGCKPNFVSQSCEPGGEKSFDLVTVNDLNWPNSDAEKFDSMNETECRDNCLKDCFCFVAIFNNQTCWKKKYPLSNGRNKYHINSGALIKFSTVNNTSAGEEGKRGWGSRTIVVVATLLGSSVILNLFVVSALFYINRKRCVLRSVGSSFMPGISLCSFTYKQLEEATNGFSEEIGRGSFGTVYKGVLPLEPRIVIAVKRLENSFEMEEAEKDFMNEVQTIGQTHHKNLVGLLGFCKEGTHRLLVLEYMPNGTMSKYLFRSDPPGWNERIQIALGIAGGLAYLHEECRTQVIHCDIKPHNILLDENSVARISDFGLAKLLRLEQTRTSTGVRGTIGYFAPEWFKNSGITAKVDVYSYGVMLLEIISCRKNLEWDHGWGSSTEVKAVLTEHAIECYRSGRLELLVEEDEEARKDRMRLERFVMVALSCIQEEPWLRPSMKKAVQMLEGTIQVATPTNIYSLHM